MICGCGSKLKCYYSVPVQTNVRYRAYKCLNPACGLRGETLEVPAAQVTSEEGKALLRGARKRREHLAFVMSKKRP